jgi:hypothetical protein
MTKKSMQMLLVCVLHFLNEHPRLSQKLLGGLQQASCRDYFSPFVHQMCPPSRKFIRKYFHIKASSSRLGWVVETSKKPHKSKSPAAHIAEKIKRNGDDDHHHEEERRRKVELSHSPTFLRQSATLFLGDCTVGGL